MNSRLFTTSSDNGIVPASIGRTPV